MARRAFSGAGVLGFCESEGHVEPAVSVRLRRKNHEIQTEVHSDSNNSLNVCPIVEDVMVEEDMDDKEEQSEESRGVSVGQMKMMTPTLDEREEQNGHTFPNEAGADVVSLHGPAILFIEAESLQRRSKMTKT